LLALWYETWCPIGARILGLVFWIWSPLLVYRLPNWMERVMFAVANFVGMEFNTISFVGSFVSLFIYFIYFSRWGMVGCFHDKSISSWANLLQIICYMTTSFNHSSCVLYVTSWNHHCFIIHYQLGFCIFIYSISILIMNFRRNIGW
jgi:hypothetical protein